MELLIGLAISSIIGFVIGQTRGRSEAGLLLGFLFGPLGWLLVLVGPNPKREKEEKDKQAVIQRQFALYQAQLEELIKMQIPAHVRSCPDLPPLGARETIYIAKNGESLEPMTIAEAKKMLNDGRLSIADFYFDAQCNQWLEIAGHPTLSEI